MKQIILILHFSLAPVLLERASPVLAASLSVRAPALLLLLLLLSFDLHLDLTEVESWRRKVLLSLH